MGETLAFFSITASRSYRQIQEKNRTNMLLSFSSSHNILDAFLENSTYCSDLADLSLELGGIAGPTERTFLYWLSTVDGPIGCSTDVKRVVHVIIELVGICGVLLTGRQNFAGLKEGRNILLKRTKNCKSELK